MPVDRVEGNSAFWINPFFDAAGPSRRSSSLLSAGSTWIRDFFSTRETAIKSSVSGPPVVSARGCLAAHPRIPPVHLPISAIEFIPGHLAPKPLRLRWGSVSLFRGLSLWRRAGIPCPERHRTIAGCRVGVSPAPRASSQVPLESKSKVSISASRAIRARN